MGSAGVITGGLDGVVVADTRLSEVDGERGRLVIAGYDVESLAGRVTFEQAVALLLDGVLPGDDRRRAVADGLAEGRAIGYRTLELAGDALDAPDAMDALRTAASHLRVDGDEERAALQVIGALGTFAAAWARRREGRPAVAPSAAHAHAVDVLRMLQGEAPDAARAAGLDAYLVTVSDHGMNASSFTARVIASTRSDLVSCVVGAIGALKGPLHGGAPGPVLSMLDAIGSPEQATSWLERELAEGRRVMGMGHRIYRVRDPRAAVLERAITRLEDAGVSTGRLALARSVERAAEGVLRRRHPERPLHANVEFYTAVLLDALGLPRELFSATFAVARAAGWCAHVFEQRAAGRLIRPSSRYVGPAPRDAGGEDAIVRSA
jgi:citrate synthase